MDKFRQMNDQQQSDILLVAQALEEGDYATARQIQNQVLADLGRVIEQI